MNTETTSAPVRSKAALWTGRVMSYLPCALLLFSGAMKFTTSPQMEEGLARMGLKASLMPILGVLEITCTLLYLVPRTSILGAILLTGYLGGAILTHVRVGEPVYTQVVLGVLFWGGLYLRELRLRALIPLRS